MFPLHFLFRCFMLGGDVPPAWAHCLCSLALPLLVLNWGLRPRHDVTVQAATAHGPVFRSGTMMPFSSQARKIFFFFQRKIKCLRPRLFFAAISPPPSGVWFVPAPQRCRRVLTGMPAPMGKTPDTYQGCCALECWSSRRLSVRHHLSTCGFCSCE